MRLLKLWLELRRERRERLLAEKRLRLLTSGYVPHGSVAYDVALGFYVFALIVVIGGLLLKIVGLI